MDSSEISIGSVIKSAVTDTIETNASFQSSAGIRAKIKRVAHAGCCDTCKSLSGEWYYSEAPKGVYWRHGNCSCTVTYDPGTGKVQDVHTKTWSESSEALEQRKEFAQKDTSIPETRKSLNRLGVDINAPKKLSGDVTEDEIIARIAGEDKSGGSCSSAALAYIGNKAGYDVLDFRGGESRNTFSRIVTLKEIISYDGVIGTVEKNYNAYTAAYRVLEKVESGKEYYFAAGKHAAIIRKVEPTGAYEYLELQSPYAEENGFSKLTKKILKERFGCTKSKTEFGFKFEQQVILIDAESLEKSDEFIKLLSYINTAPEKQLKGATGNVK